MIDTIIFDLDGTLLNTEKRHYQCYCDILRNENFSPLSFDEYWIIKSKGKCTRELLRKSKANMTNDHFIKFCIDIIEKKHYLIFDSLQKNVLEVLYQWKKLQLKFVIVTLRKNSINLQWQLKKLKIFELFDQIITTSGSNELQKVDLIKKPFQIDVNKTLWFGDTEADIQASQALNIKICALSSGIRNENFLKKFYPTYLEKNISTFFDKHNNALFT